jgi:aconitate hydratase
MLRKKGVVGKFVEFYGPASTTCRSPTARPSPTWRRNTARPAASSRSTTRRSLPAPHRPRRGARRAGRGLCQGAGPVARRATPDPVFTDTLELDMGTVEPSLAGPKRPQDRVRWRRRGVAFAKRAAGGRKAAARRARRPSACRSSRRRTTTLGHGDVVIAAITSCTNTSNPSRDDRRRPVAQGRRAKGLKAQALGEDLARPARRWSPTTSTKAGLQADLDALGFNLVGYGCTTCIGNSGPLPSRSRRRSTSGDLVAPRCCRATATSRAACTRRARQLPRLAAAGRRLRARRHDDIDLTTEPLGKGKDGKPVYLKDIWPTSGDRRHHRRAPSTPRCSASATPTSSRATSTGRRSVERRRRDLRWDDGSTYVQNPPYFEGMTMEPAPVGDIVGARVLALLGDSITTDHISPAGSSRPTARPAST